ncbi:molybdopterin-containing oxidoreductase family protein [Leptothoe spongobia]|uniref:Molybdopterin oxidoreductase family protein n=1 Tax=Leptothoe spongobia TAU-MAC 1115 TaxID=1967444 RepID=A0A947DHG6_9CYAN|nr:molybdopterin oxidoreductase family protein [Leptothoe spongobia]MBT9316860.1 molybdopterin oxidoreductase family protein [Leptothoe spongobia TAU-MAC 1115]
MVGTVHKTLEVVHGACPHDCPDTCSMLVTVEDGRATKVEGNPEHPFTQGTLCGKVSDYLDRVYSEDRLLYPMRRVGPKGSGQFERISWDEALTTITEKFKATIAEYGAEAIMPCSYLGHEGLLNGLTVGDAFFNRLGATVTERTMCISCTSTAYLMTYGPTHGTDPDTFRHSKYIVLWGCNALSTNVHLWPFIQAARKNGAKLVSIDPVRTRTAKQSDWHIPIRPGTDGALALGMMHVIINEGLTDDDYIENYTVGFEELKARVQDYPPEKVAEITGIATEDIITLAREFAATQPAVIRIGVALEKNAGGGQGIRAISCLPALVGAWRHLGGGMLQAPMWPFPIRWDVVHRPHFIKPGTRVLNQWQLGRILTNEVPLDPPVKMLFVYNCNPVTQAAEQEKILTGLARDDLFTVVSEQFLTDTADYADIVLPATTQVENLDLMFSWGHTYVTLNNAAIAPLGEAVSNTELFRRLAAKMGFEEDCFKLSDEELTMEVLDWSAPVMDGIDMDVLKAQGYAKLKIEDVPHAEGNFPTPSGKCEFVSGMGVDSNFVLPAFRQGYETYEPGEPVDPLPTFTPQRESARSNPKLAERYPLSLMSAKPHQFVNSCFANLPKHAKLQGGPRLIIHPEDAKARDITDGQLVKVFNDRGIFQAPAMINDMTRQGVVVAPLGYWRKLNPAGGTVNAATSATFTDMGHTAAVGDSLVEVAVAVENQSPLRTQLLSMISSLFARVKKAETPTKVGV